MDSNKIPVWDIFVRLFHWSLVVAIGLAWWTGEQGGEWMEWHQRCGYAVLGLVIFRLLWGFAGPVYARFSHFVYGVRTTLGYGRAVVQRQDPPYLSHNPLGGWAVLALLLLCALQAGTGLFANDDIFTEGPLLHLVGYDWSTEITRWHKALFNVLLAMIGLHLSAVLFHQLGRREPLLQGMFTGRKPAAGAVDVQPAVTGGIRVWVKGLVALLLAVLAVWGVVSL